MKNKFKIGTILKHTISGKILEVKDFEFFDDFFLYYFNNCAYPESQLVEANENDFLKYENGDKNLLKIMGSINLGDGWLIDPETNEPIYF